MAAAPQASGGSGAVAATATATDSEGVRSAAASAAVPQTAATVAAPTVAATAVAVAADGAGADDATSGALRGLTLAASAAMTPVAHRAPPRTAYRQPPRMASSRTLDAAAATAASLLGDDVAASETAAPPAAVEAPRAAPKLAREPPPKQPQQVPCRSVTRSSAPAWARKLLTGGIPSTLDRMMDARADAAPASAPPARAATTSLAAQRNEWTAVRWLPRPDPPARPKVVPSAAYVSFARRSNELAAGCRPTTTGPNARHRAPQDKGTTPAAAVQQQPVRPAHRPPPVRVPACWAAAAGCSSTATAVAAQTADS